MRKSNKTNKKILSISVAAYNLGDMIRENLDSFCNSDVAEYIEVIVTDDGSKDDTADIVSEYEKKYPQTVKLVRQKNAGPGSTVNSGIENAIGKYFKMVDGDDWVETNNLKEYIDFLLNNDIDMVITNYEIYDNEKKEIIDTVRPDLSTNTILDFNDNCVNLNLNMHSVTYKTEILQKNKIRLDNGFYTDVEYLLLPVPYVKTIAYLDLNIYVYRVAQATQSVSIPSMQKNIHQHDIVLKRLVKFYEDSKGKIENEKLIYLKNRISSMADVQLGTILTFEMSEECINNIKKFNTYLKENSLDIFNQYKRSKKAKIILYSNYKLCGLLSKLYIKKLSK